MEQSSLLWWGAFKWPGSGFDCTRQTHMKDWTINTCAPAYCSTQHRQYVQLDHWCQVVIFLILAFHLVSVGRPSSANFSNYLNHSQKWPTNFEKKKSLSNVFILLNIWSLQHNIKAVEDKTSTSTPVHLRRKCSGDRPYHGRAWAWYQSTYLIRLLKPSKNSTHSFSSTSLFSEIALFWSHAAVVFISFVTLNVASIKDY